MCFIADAFTTRNFILSRRLMDVSRIVESVTDSHRCCICARKVDIDLCLGFDATKLCAIVERPHILFFIFILSSLDEIKIHELWIHWHCRLPSQALWGSQKPLLDPCYQIWYLQKWFHSVSSVFQVFLNHHVDESYLYSSIDKLFNSWKECMPIRTVQ